MLSSVCVLYPAEIENARILLQHGDHSVLHPSPLPRLDVVQNAAPRLLEAIALQDGNGAVKALGDMGIFALCLAPEQLFGRLEFRVGCVIGPAQLVPLVELAIVAAELNAYERAGSYIAKAHTLAPGAPELHDLHTVAGIVALSVGKIAEAKECLSESVRVCEKNEFACLACGIRAFNLLLAEKPLEHGEDAAVVDYLSRCQ